MKTEVIMQRNLHGVEIRQSSKDSFFNANDLLNLYNASSAKEKSLDDYFVLKSTKSYMSAIQADILNTHDSGELELPVIVRTKRGKYGGTWLHPYLFIDFAMWLSPEFKLTCVKWIYDKLIQVRNSAGDGFKRVNEALFLQDPNKTPAPFDYANEAKMINKIVFGDPKGGQRNTASEEQLSLLDKLQKADVKLIEENLDYYERYEKLKELRKYF